MIDFKDRLQAALKELEAASVAPYPTVPRFYSWLWKFGIPIKPAPYEKLWVNTTALGVLWGLSFALGFYLLYLSLIIVFGFSIINVSWATYGLYCAIGGTVFGFAMAMLARHDHKKHNLTEWDQLA